jgi:hypothetical protein
MKKHQLAQRILKLNDKISELTYTFRTELDDLFVASSKNNEIAEQEYEMHGFMVDYLLSSAFASQWKKAVDSAKKSMDMQVEDLGNDPSGIPERTINLHENNVFKFTKRQNKDGTTTLVTDLINALARAGVEKAVVDKAMKIATKTKRGNQYYEVTPVEE